MTYNDYLKLIFIITEGMKIKSSKKGQNHTEVHRNDSLSILQR